MQSFTMKSQLFVFAIVLCTIISVYSHDVYFGRRELGDRPVFRQKLEYNAIPWIKRVKHFFYNDMQERPIKAILCYDLQHTTASVNVTAGGIGHTYANLRLKSQRSYGLEYTIEIYVEN